MPFLANAHLLYWYGIELRVSTPGTVRGAVNSLRYLSTARHIRAAPNHRYSDRAYSADSGRTAVETLEYQVAAEPTEVNSWGDSYEVEHGASTLKAISLGNAKSTTSEDDVTVVAESNIAGVVENDCIVVGDAGQTMGVIAGGTELITLAA